jgi:hypothetical protein
MQRRGAAFAILAAASLTAGCAGDTRLDRQDIASGTDRFAPLTGARPLPQGHPVLPDGHPPIPEAHPVCPGGGAVPQWGLEPNPAREMAAAEIISI